MEQAASILYGQLQRLTIDAYYLSGNWQRPTQWGHTHLFRGIGDSTIVVDLWVTYRQGACEWSVVARVGDEP